MARRRFFVPEIRRGAAELTGADAEHLVRVLRAEVGQIYEISDNQDLYLAEIEVARKAQVLFRITHKLAVPPPAVHLILVPALIKFDRFETLIEKSTELGVEAILPFEAGRTEHGLGQAAQKRHARWERIGVEASQQARRAHLPRIELPVRFAKAIETEADVRLLLDEAAQEPIGNQLPAIRAAADRVALLTGPEGGWTEEERGQAIAAGWAPCSLGNLILRAETAAIAGLAVIQAAWTQSGTQPGTQPGTQQPHEPDRFPPAAS